MEYPVSDAALDAVVEALDMYTRLGQLCTIADLAEMTGLSESYVWRAMQCITSEGVAVIMVPAMRPYHFGGDSYPAYYGMEPEFIALSYDRELIDGHRTQQHNAQKEQRRRQQAVTDYAPRRGE